jgi:Transposase and inactivated derivatives, IS30 family
MSNYHHLTLMEREMIMLWLSHGFSITWIANYLSRSKSTISREIKRNASHSYYRATTAQKKYETRRIRCRMQSKLSDERLKETIREKIELYQWSPEQIAGRLSYENSEYSISYSTIYRALHNKEFNRKGEYGRGLILKLRRKGKTVRRKLEKRGKIIISNPIEARPEEANKRLRIGDWEGDTVAGAINKPCLVTLTDRCSRFLLSKKSQSKLSGDVNEVMLSLLDNQPVFTVTLDRGKEFAKHHEITKETGIEFYFPAPHQPWARGTNENTNGLLREYFPKGTDISLFTDRMVEQVVYNLNTRPRKCLGYATPYEVFYSTSLHLT